MSTCSSTLLSTPIERFCGETLSNYSLLFSSETPDFEGCLKNTVFVWVPCTFLLLCTIYVFLVYRKVHVEDQERLPWTWLNISKSIICIAIIGVWICQLIWAFCFKTRSCLYPVDYVTPICMILSFILLLVLMIYLKSKAIVSSAVLYISWILFLIFGSVEFCTNIASLNRTNFSTDVLVTDICFIVYYCLLFIEIVLLSFADKRSNTFEKEKNACPRDYASFLNRLIYGYFWKIAILGWKRSLTRDDLWNLSKVNQSKLLTAQFEHYFTNNKQKSSKNSNITYELSVKNDSLTKQTSNDGLPEGHRCPSIPWTLVLCFKGILIPATVLNFFQVLLQFVSPEILNVLLNFVQDPTKPLWFGLVMAFLLFFFANLQTLFQQQAMNRMFLFGLRLKTVLTATIYKKTLRLSNNSRRTSTSGEIVNHMSVDVQRFMDVSPWIQMLWTTPLQIVLALYFLYQKIEWAAFVGFAVVLILMPVNFKLTKLQKEYQVIQMKFKDKRIKLMSEILNGIKVLKLYAWETPFETKVMQFRAKELDVIRRAAIVAGINAFTLYTSPFLVAVVSFAAYCLGVSPDGQLSPQVAFVSLSLFNILRGPLNGLPSVISMLVQANVSNKRLRNFLSLEEINCDNITRVHDLENSVTIENGYFKWDRKSDKFTLENINLKVKHGQLIAVVGQVGEGKSSLLSALLGEMEMIKGCVSISGSVAYVPQQAWIRNATVRQNVEFTKPFVESTYRTIIHSCALEDDLAILPGGDDTEIGEKGINLSGGQKQRISLARAVYQDRDIYLLDDPLSAVDAHVGKHIFDNVISNDGLLKNKTRILVTHGLAYLKHMDQIVVLKESKITEMGTFRDLIKHGGSFADFFNTYMSQLEKKEEIDEEEAELLSDVGISDVSKHLQAKIKTSIEKQSIEQEKLFEQKQSVIEPPKENVQTTAAGKLIKEEKIAEGKVTWKVYRSYAISVGYCACLGVMIAFLASMAFEIGTNLWLAEWSDENITTTHVALNTRLGVYFALGITQGMLIFCATILLAYTTVSASNMLHKKILHNLLKVPLNFYEVTPMGAVINRIGKDVDVMDNSMPSCIRQCIMALLGVLSSLILIMISTPIFGIVILPMGLFYYFVQKFYICTARQLQRLASVSRSPIFSFFGESIQGVTSIRAYQVSDWFVDENDRRIDTNQMAYYPTIISTIFFAALFAVLDRERGSVSPGLIGLSITYALTMTLALLMSVRTSSDLETNIVAVERIKEYTDMPTEAEWETDIKPAKDWPQQGRIEIIDYRMKYRKNLDDVLKGINCSVSELQKIGVVGRTGAGKSSLSLALFRIVESSGGKIIIDDIDISLIGLHDLRSKLAIIPQDPVLFSGTLRSNLDPFHVYSDSDLWLALEQAHLKNYVSNLREKLEHEVSEGGESLSVGQRQLVCLARALLKNSKILIFDEATAAIDMETESLIQETINNYFKNCTIITIAHRLNTILDSDKIMVMSQGKILEFDSPENLLNNTNSTFYKMAKDSGLV